MNLAEKAKRYTYSEYLSWPDDERWELIDGAPYNMTPAPGIRHQSIVVLFSRILGNKISGGPCNLFVAPTDVVLSESDVVQPDIFVVCDKKKITEASIQGAPDLAIEVLSPATALKDRREKKTLYERHGVLEYILVDPIEGIVERYMLGNGQYGKQDIFGAEETLIVRCLGEIEIQLSEIFAV